MNLFGHKRKRIFFLFFVGIVLPSLLLGYLAFRGVKNDQALVEKNRLDDQRRNAESVIRTLGASVSAVELDFQKTLADRPSVAPGAFLQSLEKFKFEHPSVEDIFFFLDAGRIRFPIAKLLFLPKDLLPLTSVDPWLASLAEKIMAAQRLEFEQRNYRGALERYQQLFDANADPQTKGPLLNAMARVQKKTGLIAEAARSYAAIARDFDRVRIAGGMPLGLAARLELGSLQAASNNFLSAAKTYLELYKILVQGGFTIEAALYENAVQTLKNSLAEIFSKAAADPEVQSQRNVFLDLENEEREKRKVTDRLFLFLAGAAPNLKAGTAEASGASSVAATRLTLELEKNSYLVMALEDNLRLEGYEVSSAKDGPQGFSLANEQAQDLIILDIMLPKMDGFEVCKKLRQAGIATPILMLTAKSREADKVLGLELGADDYMTKPFSPRELLARVRALLRRAKPQQPDIDLCRFVDVEIDFKKYEAKKGEMPIELSALEFSLLHCLIRNKDRAVSRDALLDAVWGEQVYVDPRTVDKHISQLRKKIEDDPQAPKFILGVRGVGYKFGG